MEYIKIKLENDKIFKNRDFPDMISETFSDFKEAEKITRNRIFRVCENISPVTTVKAILENSHYDKVIALNFANAMYAGGGYILGGNAQEESLCRASMLYYTIRNQKKYYWKNRFHILPDYTDTMIYSHNVPVIHDDSGKLLENAVKCDFITCPAVNRTFARFMFTDKNIERKMEIRINKIISLAVSQKPDVLILGAFGCGMFGNKRDIIFRIFKDAINNFVPDNIKIIFAVPDFKGDIYEGLK